MPTWSDRELQYLKDNYRNTDIKQLVEDLWIISNIRRSSNSVQTKAKRLGLNHGFYWSYDEIAYLSELIHQYPLGELVRKYNLWANKNNYRTRSRTSLIEKIRYLGGTLALKESIELCTVLDLQTLLGCSRNTARLYFHRYSTELNLKKPVQDDHQCKDNSVLYCTYKDLKKFLVENPSILEKYRQTLDLNWLVTIIST